MSSRYAQLIASATTEGIKAVIQSVFVLVFVLGVQIVAVILVIGLGVAGGIMWLEVVCMVLSVVVATASIIACGYLCYTTSMNKIVAVCIESAEGLFTEIGAQLATALQKKTGMKQLHEYGSVAAVMDVGTFIKQTYNNLPWLVRMALEFVLGRLPTGSVLTHVMKEDDESENVEAGRSQTVTTIAEEYVLSHDSFAWLFWFVPLIFLLEGSLIVLQILI